MAFCRVAWALIVGTQWLALAPRAQLLGSGSHMHSTAVHGECAKSLPVQLVNDDFCDCVDGSDEPDTAACSFVDPFDPLRAGDAPKFICKNDGHVAKKVSPSRVGDGVCDCCDGTDEPTDKCTNDCFEVGRAWRAARAEAEKAVRAGLEQRAVALGKLEQSVKDARRDIGEKKSHLSQVQAYLQVLRDHLQIEEECEYAEKLAKKCEKNNCVQPLSRIDALVLRSIRLLSAKANNSHAQAIWNDMYNVSGKVGDVLTATDDGDSESMSEWPKFVIAHAFLSSSIPTTAEMQCHYRSHEHEHWTSLPARVIGTFLSPLRLIWKLGELCVSLVSSRTAEDVSAPWSSKVGLAGPVADVVDGTQHFFASVWDFATLGWIPEMISPSVDKRHKRVEAEMLRQFVKSAVAEEATLARALARLEELTVLDTKAPDALLYLLGDECFELKDNEYTYVMHLCSPTPAFEQRFVCRKLRRGLTRVFRCQLQVLSL